MPVTALSLGLQTVLVANQVYALPAASTQISWQSSAGSDLLVSLDGVNFSSLAGASAPNQALSAFTAAAFVKCATANTSVLCKNAPVAGGLTGSGSSTVTGNLTVTGNVTGASGIFDILKLDKTNQDVVLSRGGAGVLTLKNGANPQTLQVFGNASQGISLSHDGTNGHLATAGQLLFNVGGGDRWAISSSTLYPLTDNVYDIGGPGGAIRRLYVATSILNANGTAAAPAYSFGSDTDTGFYSELANVVSMSAGGTRAFLFQAGILNFRNDSATIYFGSADDLAITREAANTLAQRNGVNAQTFNIYNTYTNASNFERLETVWSANNVFIQTSQAGTGLSRSLYLGTTSGGQLKFMTAGTTRWVVDANGHILAQTDNANDIGSNGTSRPRNIYAAGTINAAGNATCNSLIATDSGGAVTTTLNITSAVNARVLFTRSDQATDAKLWSIQHGGSMLWVTLTDAGGVIGNQLALSRTGNLAIQSTGSLVNRVKAGTPVDADVTNPADGMMMIDSTANKIWVRLGGAWKGVVVS